MRILLIEDDPVLHEVTRRSLEDADNYVDSARTLATAMHIWSVQPFDAVVLDLNLPDGSGLTALRVARARGDRTPVLVLTARNRTDERIAGLDAGADDYLGKPLDLAELAARLRALARRAHGADALTEVGQLRFDRAAGRLFFVRVPGPTLELELPAREYAVLVELLTPPGRVVSKKALSEKLSNFDDHLGDNALEAFVSRLRKKLVGSGATIRTLRGLGYVIDAERSALVHPTVSEGDSGSGSSSGGSGDSSSDGGSESETGNISERNHESDSDRSVADDPTLADLSSRDGHAPS